VTKIAADRFQSSAILEKFQRIEETHLATAQYLRKS